MRVLNPALNGLFEILLVTPAILFREAGLLLVSGLFGVGMVLLFRRFSRQESIRRSKDAIKGHLLSLSLYPHEIGLMIRTYGRIFATLGKYLALVLAPGLWLVLPFLLVAVQVELRFGRLPLRVGQAAVVSALFDGERGLPEDVLLEASPGLEVETPRPVRIPQEGEVAWRVRALEPGDLAVRVVTGGDVHEKTVTVADGIRTLSVERPGPGILAQIANPLERPLPGDAGPRSIRVEYPRGNARLIFWETHWLVFFLVVSIGVALIVRVPLKVHL